MPSLQIRDLPESLYYRILTRAREEHRSLAQQAMILLEEGLKITENPSERRRKILEELNDFNLKKSAKKLTPPCKLIREDRKR